MAKGKGKGSAYERELCRQLSLWWSNGTNDSIYWRTSNSGGRATIRQKVGKGIRVHCGDVCAIEPDGQPLIDLITLEAKKGYSKYTIADLLDKGPKAALQEWESWYIQATEAAERAGTKYWMIVQRRDQRVPLAFFPYQLFAELLGWSPCLDMCTPFLKLHMQIEGRSACTICGMRLEDFLARVKPEHIRRLANDK